jgi:hypothetical protein
MKKNYVARFLLGMALLGSSVMGYGMESNEVIGKQKMGATQATDKLEQGEYRVSKGVFKECFDCFLNDNKDLCNPRDDSEDLCENLNDSIYPEDIVEESLKQVFEDKRHHNHFKTNPGEIKKSLADDYEKAKNWLLDNRQWVKDFSEFLSNKGLSKYSNSTSKDFLPLLKGEHLDNFLKSLSENTNQTLKDKLENLQGTKNGVFTENRDQCAQQLSQAVLGFLDSENKDENDFIRCKFYDLVGEGNIKRPYCMAYVDLKGFTKDPMATLHFYHPDALVKEKPTNTLVMVFRNDCPSAFKISLKNAYPWLGRDVFLKTQDKDKDQNIGNLAEQLEEGNRMCKGFFGKEQVIAKEKP